VPAAFAADFAAPTVWPAARFAWVAAPAAALPCRVDADFVPRVAFFDFCALRARVAAPFFAAAWRSAFVCAI
jgi:hypothetical protein